MTHAMGVVRAERGASSSRAQIRSRSCALLTITQGALHRADRCSLVDVPRGRRTSTR